MKTNGYNATLHDTRTPFFVITIGSMFVVGHPKDRGKAIPLEAQVIGVGSAVETAKDNALKGFTASVENRFKVLEQLGITHFIDKDGRIINNKECIKAADAFVSDLKKLCLAVASAKKQYDAATTVSEQALAGFAVKEQEQLVSLHVIIQGGQFAAMLSKATNDEPFAFNCISTVVRNFQKIRESLSITNNSYCSPSRESIQVGSVLSLANGERAQILDLDQTGKAQAAILRVTNEISLETLDLSEMLSKKLIFNVENNDALLKPSIPITIKPERTRWKDLSDGDLLRVNEEGRVSCEEILSSKVANNQLVTTSIVRSASGTFEFRENCVRGAADQDIEQTHTQCSIEIRRAPSLRSEIQSRFSLYHRPLPEKSSIIEYAQLALTQIELCATNFLVQYMDAARQGSIPGEEFKKGIQNTPDLLNTCQKKLLQVLALSDKLLNSLEQFATTGKILSFVDQIEIGEELQKVYRLADNAKKGNLPTENQISVLLQPLITILNKINRNEDNENAVRPLSTIIEIDSALRSLRNDAKFAEDFFAEDPQKTFFHTEHLGKGEVMSYELLKELSALIATAPTPATQSERPREGVVVSDYSPAALKERFERGLEVLTYRDQKTGRLLGAILFYPKGVYSSSGKAVHDSIPNLGEKVFSELDLIIIHPEAQGFAASNIILDAHLLHLIRHGLNGAVSEVLGTNKKSFGLFTRRADVEFPPSMIRPANESGVPEGTVWAGFTMALIKK